MTNLISLSRKLFNNKFYQKKHWIHEYTEFQNYVFKQIRNATILGVFWGFKGKET